MSDPGTGGGIESGHMRSKSDNDVPVDADVETRAVPAKTDEQTKYSAATSQVAPRQLFKERASAAAKAAAGNLPRNTLSSSTRSESPLSQSPQPLTLDAPHPEPPVTKATLSELDVTKIIHNPKLRHDINFDPELHFRPNLDGEKGRRKQEKASQFWTALHKELLTFVKDREEFERSVAKDEDWCLPSLLKAVKEIIQTLVPQRDRDFLNEGLNVELLMQQFYRGIADLEKLASWLSGVLKLHCAPMRDEWVDEMYNELSSGNRNDDMEQLVKGMRTLLSVLEAMKLDVANHQIRCLRPVLIEDTVHFEQRFFYKKIQAGKLDTRSAEAWYRQAMQDFPRCDEQQYHPFGETAVFFVALSRLVLPSTSVDQVPKTFLFDEERILKLRSDMLDAINLEICVRLFEELDRLPKFMPNSFHAPRASVPAHAEDETRFSASEFNFNTPSSRPSSFVFSTCGSDSSSPRGSGCMFTNPAAPDPADARTKARNFCSTLLALLQTAPPALRSIQRWQDLVPAIAIETVRSLDFPLDFLPTLENKLMHFLCDLRSDKYQSAEADFHERLMLELAKRVRAFRDLSGSALFAVATGGRIQNPATATTTATGRPGTGVAGAGAGPMTEATLSMGGVARECPRERDLLESVVREAREEGGLEDMATRLAHLGLLHWRVWAPLAYVPDVGCDAALGTYIDSA